MTPSFGGGSLLGQILWTVGSDYLTADNKPGFTTPEVKQSFAKMRELFVSKSLLLGSPTDWWDPSSFTQGLAAMQWCGLWAMPGIQKAIGDDFGVVAWPAFSASVGKPSTFAGGWGAMVSAKSKNVDAAKAYVKWLWIENTKNQEDFNLSYGFHVPPRKSLAAKASKLQSGPAADALKIFNEYAVAANPAWTPKMNSAYADAATAIVRKGGDIDARSRHGARRWSTPSSSGCSADMATPDADGAGRRPGGTGRAGPGAGSASPRAFWLFVGPFLVGLVIFVYVPIVWSVILSFSRAQNTVTPGDWVGLGNYIDLLRPGPFLDSLITFTVFAAFIVPLTFVLSLGLALLLNRSRFMRAFFRSVFFLPTACSYVVASLVWKMSIFNGVRFGLANTVLELVRRGQHRLAGHHQPAVVLAGARHRPALAADRAST